MSDVAHFAMSPVLIVDHVFHLSVFEFGSKGLDGWENAFVLSKEKVLAEKEALIADGPDPDAIMGKGLPSLG